MPILKRIAKALGALVIVIVLGAIGYLYFAPPEMLRVASNYTAKIVCSNVFVAGRDAPEVTSVDVQAGGHPILGYINVDVNVPESTVTARLIGLFATGTSVYREGLGCAAAPDGDVQTVKSIRIDREVLTSSFVESPWEMASSNPKVEDILTDDSLLGPQMRAVVVIKDGKLLAETYGAGFDETTPLLGWSMAKTVTAMIIGTALNQDFQKTSDGLFDIWQSDERAKIQLQDLMSMSSGLHWNEGYGSVSDVTRMLYLEPDMAKFVASQELETPTANAKLHYSSGTTVLLSRAWQNAVGENALAWPHQKLFGPLGAASVTLETDARGTYAGSSYIYASARDWARFGQLIINKGSWNNQQLLSPDYIEWMTRGNTDSMTAYGEPEYGNGQIWLHGPRAGTPRAENPDAAFDLPNDIRWFLGHDGQSIAVIPSEGLVVVRMGLTPSHHKYKPQALLKAILDATQG